MHNAIDLAASANVQKKWSTITRIVITYVHNYTVNLDFGPEHFVVVVIMHCICFLTDSSDGVTSSLYLSNNSDISS